MALKEEIYKEAGINYRFFLGWRHASAAGYLVILGAVVALGISAFKEAKELLWVIPLCAAPVGFILWLIDLRTRDAYHAAVRAGKELEAPEGGFFTVMADEVVVPRDRENSEKKKSAKMTHSMALALLFNGGSLLLLLLAGLLYCRYG